MTNYITKINQIITNIEQSPNLGEFETVELPFKLVDAAWELMAFAYPPQQLQQLADADPDTLDAWGLALAATMEMQLQIMGKWQQQLTSLPLPDGLKAKITDGYDKLGEIAANTSQLMADFDSLLRQEKQLKEAQAELHSLQQTAAELQQIQTELETGNMEQLRLEIASLEAALAPERETLASLQQQKGELTAEMSALKQQKERLMEAINYLNSGISGGERETMGLAREMLNIHEGLRQELSASLASILADVGSQQAELRRIKEQIQTAVQEFNQYQRRVGEMQGYLQAHYQRDRELGQLLPVNQQKVNNLIDNIQQNLAKLDSELAAARSVLAESQQKITLSF
ncbi:MAG: hypothetical protein Fur0025_41590 [Oscillatoriaceae cyanobacterium]